MRKDKEWLKEELRNMEEKSATHKLRARMTNDEMLESYYEGSERSFRRSVEKVTQLEEPEITEEQAWEVIAQKYGGKSLENNIGYIKSEGYAVVKKPVIPQYVADFIESYRNHSLHSALESAYEGFEDLQVYDWMGNGKREETFARAWLDGFEVEKEKLYTVCLGNLQDSSEELRLFRKRKNKLAIDFSSERFVKGNKSLYELTEKEIKDYDERMWAFAEEVTHD